jgi:hypothetical protein
MAGHSLVISWGLGWAVEAVTGDEELGKAARHLTRTVLFWTDPAGGVVGHFLDSAGEEVAGQAAEAVIGSFGEVATSSLVESHVDSFADSTLHHAVSPHFGSKGFPSPVAEFSIDAASDPRAAFAALAASDPRSLHQLLLENTNVLPDQVYSLLARVQDGTPEQMHQALTDAGQRMKKLDLVQALKGVGVKFSGAS